MSDRLVPFEQSRSLETPFTTEWENEVKSSFIPPDFRYQCSFFMLWLRNNQKSNQEAFFVKHKRDLSFDPNEASAETWDVINKFLGIGLSADPETTMFALGYGSAVAETKLALKEGIGISGLDVTVGDVVYPTRFYDDITVGAIKEVEALDDSGKDFARNRLTHFFGLSRFAKGVREKFGGNLVGLSPSEQEKVIQEMGIKFSRDEVINEGFDAFMQPFLLKSYSDKDMTPKDRTDGLMTILNQAHSVYALTTFFEASNNIYKELPDTEETKALFKGINERFQQKMSDVIMP